MKALITLSLSESKRLIAKGIASLKTIEKALEKGVIALPLCTTNAYIIEELTGTEVEDKGRFSCGIMTSLGPCLNRFAHDKKCQAKILVNGEMHDLQPEKTMFSIVTDMGCDDVVIKSGNVLDSRRKAAVMVGDIYGGEIGQILPVIATRGINLIVPMVLSKTIPIAIEEAIAECGIFNIDKAMGLKFGLLPLHGYVFTEVNAIGELTGARAIPIAAGSSGGEIATTLMIKGSDSEVEAAWNIIDSIKGEPKIDVSRMNCSDCFAYDSTCQYLDLDMASLPKWMF